VVRFVDGAVRLPDGTLAGSACPLDRALRNLVGLGIPLESALAALTSRPAGLLGLPGLGRIAPGLPADVVVLDDDLQVCRVLVAGVEV
jgi:N-acetylglucosamine-6-phosphate deacetylase